MKKVKRKDVCFTVRVSAETRLAFQQVAKRRGVKMSKLIIDFVNSEIDKEGLSIVDFIPENQLSLLDEIDYPIKFDRTDNANTKGNE